MGGDNTKIRGGRKGVSLKGVVMVDTWRGKLRIRKWPAPRPNRTIKQLNAEDKFRQAQWLWRYIDPRLQIDFIETSQGGPFYPRDLYTKLVYGRGPWFIDGNTGRKVFPVAFQQDVSQSLDALFQTEGGLLVRGASLWEGLDAGTSGYVLKSNGPGNALSWQAESGGGSSPIGCTIQRSTGQTTVGSYNFAVITFDTEVIDDSSFWSAANPTQFITPSDGWYSVECKGKSAASTESGREFRAELNGSDTPGSGSNIVQDGRSALSGYNDPWFAVQHFIKLSAGDVIRFFLSGRENVASITSIEASVVRL